VRGGGGVCEAWCVGRGNLGCEEERVRRGHSVVRGAGGSMGEDIVGGVVF
jgi:hypothetical protein